MDCPESNNLSNLFEYINTIGSICSITGISILFVATKKNKDRQEMLEIFLQNALAVMMSLGVFGFCSYIVYIFNPLSQQVSLLEKLLGISILLIFESLCILLSIGFFFIFKGIVFLVINIGQGR